MKFPLSALLLLFSTTSFSQTSEVPTPSPAGNSVSASNAGDSAAAMPALLDQLQTTGSQAAQDIGHLHIEKWKANPAAKSAAQADAESVQRNLTTALPGLIAAVRTAPDDVGAQFKLYRNLNALYDVFGTVTEATRVFGQKGEYETLSQQLQVMGSARRKLGEELEQLTRTNQGELDRMRAQIRDQQEQLEAAKAAAAEARKELLVAQTEPPKKPASKKKAVAKKPLPASTGPSSGSSSSNPSNQTGSVAPAPKG